MPVKTYGVVTYRASGSGQRGFWCIECEPHVAIQLKRIFGKIDKSKIGSHELSDTPENARNILWFMMRYPLMVSTDAQARLDGRSAEHVERQSIAEELIAGRMKPMLADLAIPLRDYQEIAAAMMLHHKRILLADSMGLGKTISAIGAIVDPAFRPALVVTLTHLPIQWQKEIARFAPQLRTHILKTATPYPLNQKKSGHGRRASDEATPDVIITSYSKLHGWGEHLGGLIRGCVFDEIQELRHADTDKYNAAAHIADRAEFCEGLSGTPVYNMGSELHTVMRIIRPDGLGTRGEFLREWCGAGQDGKERVKNPRALGLYMRDEGLMLRRTRADVGRELPKLSRVLQNVDANAEALEKIGPACRELALFLLGRGANPLKHDGDHRGDQMLASEELSSRLRQATGIAKSAYVADFVRLLVESGEKVLLFGWHRAVYEIWLDRLKDFRPVMFTGSENAKQKETAKQALMSGDSRVLIMSLRAGAGIDGLQSVCNTVVFGELDWSYGVMEQNEARIDRDGQKIPVIAYYLLAEIGSDPIVVDVVNLKGSQLAGIRDPDNDIIEKMQADPGKIRKMAEAYLAQGRQWEKKEKNA